MFRMTGIRRWMTGAAAGLSFGMALAAPGDDAERIKQLEQQLARSQQLIEQLAARVAALERASGAAVAAPAAASAAQASAPAATDDPAHAIAALQESINQIADGLSRSANDTGTPLHGFVDVGAGWSSSGDPNRLRGFHAGSLDLYLTPQVGSRVKSLIELVVEFDEDNENAGSIDMERVQIGYTFSDALTMWGGRFHTPFGLWNTSFHHGANLQTSISRPRFIEFEDRSGLIPAHSVGIWANGKALLDVGRLTYDAYLANGPAIRDRQLQLNPFTDDNSGKMVGGNLGYQAGGAWNGLRVGMHAFATRVDAYIGGAPARSTRVRSAGGYFGYEAHPWEALGEYYRFRNVDVGDSAVRSSHAGFVQLGRTFGALTPYVRYEHVSLDPRDNYFRSLRAGRSSTHVAAGARYALDANSSLKFEWRESHESAAMLLDEQGLVVQVPSTSYRRALFQYSIAF